jgi:hypothetical protein
MKYVILPSYLRRFRLVRIALLLLVGLPVLAFAEDPPVAPPNPTTSTQSVGGVNVQLSLQDLSGSSEAKFVVDYADLQDKLPAVLGALIGSNNNCASFGSNVVVSIESASLNANDNGDVSLNVKMSFTTWVCIQNAIPNTTIEYEVKQIGPLKTKVPVIRTNPGSPIKTVVSRSPDFSYNISFSLVAAPHEISINATLPDLKDVPAVAGYPSGAIGFSQNVVQVFADKFVKVLSPNDLLQKAAAGLHSGVEFQKASFVNTNNKLQAVIILK